MRSLKFARAGYSPCQSGIIFASKVRLSNKPSSAGFRGIRLLANESLAVFSLKSFEARKQPYNLSRALGTIELAPIQKTLRDVMAMCVQALPPGAEHQGDVGLGAIEAKRYANDPCKEHTTDGR